MRYLNKIIFINAASIKYAEVNVDGNVHLGGTQGVGKSTIQRAILFFYNADKLKLGITKEKRGFDEYYFPFANSYIIYEVARETGSYCILAYKQAGRVCYHFFDSPYDIEYFIDKKGQAVSSWDEIRDSLSAKKIHYSKKVDKYEEYRDILYGNNAVLPAEFRKYALLESKSYHNVPRTIQNVFLNSKLEAEFIKQTIILSLIEENVEIDLTNYMNHLKDFESQLNDIGIWSEKNAKGEIVIRKEAEKVTGILSSIRFLEHEFVNLSKQFNYAWDEAIRLLPKELIKLERERDKKKLIEDKGKNLYARYQSKRDELNKDINILDDRLNEVKRKDKYYKELNIAEIILRVSRRLEMEQQKKNLQEEKSLLTARFEEIKQKYEAIFKQLDNQKNDFINTKHAEKNEASAHLLKNKEIVYNQFEMLVKEVREQHRSELETTQNALDEKRKSIQTFKLKEAETKNKPFYQREISVCKQDIADLKEKVQVAQNAQTQAQEQILTLQKQWELDNARCHVEYASQKEKAGKRLPELTNEIALINTKLENWEGSLFEWLNKEYPGWENTIGKVVDENNILFSSGLNPQKLEHTSDLYGIRLDLSNVDREVKSLSEYEAELERLQLQIAAVKVQMGEMDDALSADLDKIKLKYNQKIRSLKESINVNRIQQEQSLLKLEEVEVKLVDWQRKAEQERKDTLAEINHSIDQLTEEKTNIAASLESIKTEIDRQIDKKEKEKKKKIQLEENAAADAYKTIEEAIRQKELEIRSKLSETKIKQNDELAGKGVDTKQLSSIEEALAHVERELKFIDFNRNLVSDYQKDKRELFDKTDEFKVQKQLIGSKLLTESEKYDTQKEKIKNEVSTIDELIKLLENETQQLQTDLDKVEQFKLMDVWRDIESNLNKEKTEKRCSELIESINNNYYKTNKRYDELKESANRFLNNFKEDNIFKFKTHLITLGEYIHFAEELVEFLEEDMISTYQNRVNKLYTDIIRLIGKETNDLLAHSASIQRTVKNINDDFVKRNFAGVIKSIELRIAGSSNKVVQCMFEIKEFNDEHSSELGEVNLFSSNNQEKLNKTSVELLKYLVKEIEKYKDDRITLSDSFELQFRIVENDNDSGWVEKLSNVGSDGTDVLVKAMINIMLLNVFKDHASKKFGDFKLHCMMDEISKLHPTNIKGILAFANSRNILLTTSSPMSFNVMDYKYTYMLRKDPNSITIVTRLIKKTD